MALGKEISVHDSGVVATYWRITGIQVDMLANETVATVSGYINLEARNTGKRPISQKLIKWVGSNNPVTPASILDGTVFTKVYLKLKENNVNPFLPGNPFIGSTDV